MFSLFYASLQQDGKLFLFFPILCAVFRLIFIAVYNPYRSLKGKGKVIWHCFRYGFWWGMDFNAYVFLIPLVVLSIPGAFFTDWYRKGDLLRMAGGLTYSLVLYLAFAGKMLFYKHFHDIFNQTMKLGAKAEKHNLVDIFFHQDHGVWILLGILPYLGGVRLLHPQAAPAAQLPVSDLFQPGAPVRLQHGDRPGGCGGFLLVPVRGDFLA